MLLYEGRIADTLFHPTSGAGWMIAAAEVFGKDVPYLVAVDDPHSALSPVHRWGPVPVADGVARKGLALKGPILGVRLAKEPSGRVRTATISTAGGETSVSGSRSETSRSRPGTALDLGDRDERAHAHPPGHPGR